MNSEDYLVTCGILVHGALSGFFIASAMAWKEQCTWFSAVFILFVLGTSFIRNRL